MQTSCLTGASLALALTLAPLRAGADTPNKADDLFKQGIAAMKAGNYEEGCPLLAQSLAIDYGMAAEFRLAECYEKQGKTASAWRAYRSVEKAATEKKQKSRARVAAARAEKLEPQLHRLAIAVPSGMRALNGLQVFLDATPIPSDQWERARAVDPGKHTLRASAPGYQPWEATVRASAAGQTQTVHMPALQANPVPKPSAPPSPPPEKKLHGRWLGGLILGGSGVAVMGVGGIFGLLAKSTYDSAGDSCTNNGCNADGVSVRKKGRTTGLVGTIIVGVGAAATATGAILWITAPRYAEQQSALGIAPTWGGATLQWKGRFE